MLAQNVQSQAMSRFSFPALLVFFLSPLFCLMAKEPDLTSHTPSEGQILRAEGASAQRKCEKYGLVSLGVGCWEVLHPHKRQWVTQVEYQSGSRWGPLHPFAAALLTGRGSLYAGVGVAYQQPLWRCFYLTPSFAPGIYLKNQGKELGSPLEFRSALTLSAHFHRSYRLGVQFSHLSNGGVGFKNPGAECLLCFLQKAFPTCR